MIHVSSGCWHYTRASCGWLVYLLVRDTYRQLPAPPPARTTHHTHTAYHTRTLPPLLHTHTPPPLHAPLHTPTPPPPTPPVHTPHLYPCAFHAHTHAHRAHARHVYAHATFTAQHCRVLSQLGILFVHAIPSFCACHSAIPVPCISFCACLPSCLCSLYPSSCPCYTPYLPTHPSSIALLHIPYLYMTLHILFIH